MFCGSNMFGGRMFLPISRWVGSFASFGRRAITTSIAASSNTAEPASLPKWKPGDMVLTWRAPGLIGHARIETTIMLRGDEHYIVVFRESPDVIYGLRDAGTLWCLDDGPPKHVTAGAA
jgi:hypothetical protein